MDRSKFIELLGSSVTIETIDDRFISGMVKGVGKKLFIIQPYRIPDGISIDEGFMLGADFHLAQMERTYHVPIDDVRSIAPITIAKISASQFSSPALTNSANESGPGE